MKTETLIIKAFGEEYEHLKERETDVVEFCVKGLGVESSTVHMTAQAVPFICSPLKDQAVQLARQSYRRLVDLDRTAAQTWISFASDLYWCFFPGHLKGEESGPDPVARKTKLGWVLSPVP